MKKKLIKEIEKDKKEKSDSFLANEILKQHDLNWQYIYTEFIKDFPAEAIEKTDKNKTGKGYNTTGFKIQYLINRINETVGVDNWGYSFEVMDAREFKTQKGYAMIAITVKTFVKIYGQAKVGVGGHKGADYYDTLKGAISNSLKKTFSFYGLGKQAYEGSIDDDNTELPVTKQIIVNQIDNSKICPLHAIPMLQGTTKTNKPYWYCKGKMSDGSYCKEKIWSNSPQNNSQSVMPPLTSPPTPPPMIDFPPSYPDEYSQY